MLQKEFLHSITRKCLPLQGFCLTVSMAPAEVQSGFRTAAENASTITQENLHLFVMKAAHTTCSERFFSFQKEASDLSSVCLCSSKD